MLVGKTISVRCSREEEGSPESQNPVVLREPIHAPARDDAACHRPAFLQVQMPGRYQTTLILERGRYHFGVWNARCPDPTCRTSTGVPSMKACSTIPLHWHRQSSRRQWKISLHAWTLRALLRQSQNEFATASRGPLEGPLWQWAQEELEENAPFRSEQKRLEERPAPPGTHRVANQCDGAVAMSA